VGKYLWVGIRWLHYLPCRHAAAVAAAARNCCRRKRPRDAVRLPPSPPTADCQPKRKRSTVTTVVSVLFLRCLFQQPWVCHPRCACLCFQHCIHSSDCRPLTSVAIVPGFRCTRAAPRRPRASPARVARAQQCGVKLDAPCDSSGITMRGLCERLQNDDLLKVPTVQYLPLFIHMFAIYFSTDSLSCSNGPPSPAPPPVRSFIFLK
jgi:hypothetical protein